MRRYDIENTKECMWIEISVSDNFNLPTGTHYFPPDCNVTIIDSYLKCLEQNLNAYQYWVIMLGDFNVPMTGLKVCHFQILTTTIKLNETNSQGHLIVLINAITLT
jgi:hypothetical protein